ncbi:BACON domain-containing protein [Persephonella sp.]
MKRIFLLLILTTSIFLFSCSGGGGGGGDSNDSGPLPTIIPEKTKVAEQTDVQNIEKVEKVNNQERIIFSKETDLLKSLKEGDILIIPPDPNKAPYGMLRKVKSKTINPDGKVIIETEIATLTEAIESGEVEGTVDLDLTQIQSQSLAKGVRIAKADKNKLKYDINTNIGAGLKLVGDISIEKPKLYFKLRISYFKLREITAKVTASETARLQIIGAAKYTIKSEVKIASMKLPPIVFSIGPVPVVITPTLEIVAGANGSVKAKVSTGVIQTLSYEIGATYTDKEGTKGINELTLNFKPSALDFEGKVNVHPYVKGGFYLKIYDLVGPGGAVEAYLDFNAKSNPKITCSLDAGVKSSFEIKGKVLSYAFIDVQVDLFKKEINLAKCGPPQLTVSPKGIKNPSGFEGEQNFTPADFTYTLNVKNSIISGNDTIDWEATSTVPWLIVSQTSGTVQKGTPQTVSVSLNQTEASKLSKGEYKGFIEFKNKTNPKQPPLKLPVLLYVKGKPAIKVSPDPSSIPLVKGDEGGPFTPSKISFTITAEGGDVDWEVSKNVDWIDLSQTKGFLTDGSSITIDATINQNANSLAPGGHKGVIEFKNVTKLTGGIISGEGNTKRNIFLNANIYTYPSKLSFCAEKPGDNFIPSEQVFRIKSTKSGFTYSLGQTKSLLTFDNPTGDVPAKGEATVKAMPSNFAKSLGEGSYETTIVVGNKNSPYSFQDNGVSVTFDIGVRGCGRAFILTSDSIPYYYYYTPESVMKVISDTLGGYLTSYIVQPTPNSDSLIGFTLFRPDGAVGFNKLYKILLDNGSSALSGYFSLFNASVTTTGSYLLTMGTSNEVTNPNTGASGIVDGTLISKLDSSGNVLWKKFLYVLSSSSFFSVGDIETTINREYLLSGSAEKPKITIQDQYGNTISDNSNSIFIAKLDSLGNLLSSKHFASIEFKMAPPNITDPNLTKTDARFSVYKFKMVSNGYIMIGNIYNSSPSPFFRNGIFIINFDTSFNIVSSKYFVFSKNISNGGNSRLLDADIAFDGSSVILVGVEYTDNNNNLKQAKVLLKLDSNGGIIWGKRFENAHQNNVYDDYLIFKDIHITPDNSILLTGYITTLFTKGFVIKLDYDKGEVLWIKNYYSSKDDQSGVSVFLNSIVNTGNRGYVAVGYTTLNNYSGVLINELNPDGSIGQGLINGQCDYKYKDSTDIIISNYIPQYASGAIPLYPYTGTQQALFIQDFKGSFVDQSSLYPETIFTCEY